MVFIINPSLNYRFKTMNHEDRNFKPELTCRIAPPDNRILHYVKLQTVVY